MKNKPAKHKETNVFKFKSFADRLAEIDIRHNALYRIGQINELDETDNTYFYENYIKWTVLNLTDEYCRVQKQLRGIVTLPQLIHRKDEVVDLLLTALKEATALSVQPLLEFVVALSRDLREDFYPYFPVILDQLINLLKSKDPDQLEWTLICLAYLFKILKPYLKKDLSIIVKFILPLLSEQNLPEHLQHFAAEAFSFVARDIRDRDAFLLMIIQIVEDGEGESTKGCGRLLFEIMKGINGQLHSCADGFLKMVFMAFNNPKINLSYLFDVAVICMEHLLHFAKQDSMNVVWENFHEISLKYIRQLEQTSDISMAIHKIILLLGHSIEYNTKNCTRIDLMVEILMNLANSSLNTDAKIMLDASKIVTVILLSNFVTLTQLDASRLTKRYLSLDEHIFVEFVWNSVKYNQFEILILPEVIRFFEAGVTTQRMELLTKIILTKCPLNESGIDFTFTPYPVRFQKLETTKIISDFIINSVANEILKNPETFLMASIIFPHTKAPNPTEIINKLNEISKVIALRLDVKSDDKPNTMKLISILGLIIETLTQLLCENQTISDHNIEIIDSLLPFATNIEYHYVLNIINKILTAKRNKPILNSVLFNKLHITLSDNLSSPYHNIRLKTAHILTVFNHPNDYLMKMYEIFYHVERIEPTITTYRTQLQHLQLLSTDSELYKSIKESELKLDVVKYLIGLLYMNFKLLWDPVISLIQMYYSEIELFIFWPILRRKLDETKENILLPPNIEILADHLNQHEFGILKEFIKRQCLIYDRSDFLNYRILLWTLIPKCSNLNEIKNRELATMVIEFIDREYHRNSDNDSKFWNITVNNEEGIKIDDTIEGDEVAMEYSPKPHSTSKAIQRTLTFKLKTFINHPNPKQIYHQNKLYEIYLEMLGHRSYDIQKLALDCIMSYKHKYIQPYKEHLYGLIDDNRFKEAISNFKIGKDDTVVLDEHRNGILPIVLRILYSKMITRVGGVQKGSANNRKSLIMQFLSGCHQSEVFCFLSMAMANIEPLFDENPLKMCETIIATTNIERVHSPKKLKSILQLFDVMRQHLGGIMDVEFLKYMLNIVFSVGAICQSVIEQCNRNHTVKLTYLNMFKLLKNSCIHCIDNFFQHFTNYQWTEMEIETIFYLFIDGSIRNLASDSINQPSTLLKLLLTFGKNSRYFVLLTRLSVMDGDSKDYCTPLRYVIDLLLEQKVKRHVCSVIMQMVENLLLLQDNSENDDGSIPTPITLSSNKCITGLMVAGSQTNCGSRILLPFIGKILIRIERNLKFSRGLSKRDLLILSRSTELVMDSETCSKLFDLILPILVRRTHTTVDEDILIKMVTTVSNLLQRIDEPEKRIRDIGPLFELITSIGARKLLCDVLQKILKKRKHILDRNEGENLSNLVSIINELNSYDKRWIEQPDYEIRLQAYKRVGELIEEDRLDIDLGTLIIYHSFYFIRHDKDLAMRDSAAFYLKQIVPNLARKYQNNSKIIEFLIGDILLNLVRRSLRDRNDNVRIESISLLGEMVRECSETHPILRDLHSLTNSQDREVDFFDNIIHLQSHRHAKALSRFCSIAQKYERSPHIRTLTQFILPLASMYLCSDVHAKKNGVITAAIDAIGAVCRLLPWQQYESILKHYLNKMKYAVEYQKQLVRLVITIIDSFHFDLSKANDLLVDKMIIKEPPQKQTVELADQDLADVELKDDEDQTVLSAKDLNAEELLDIELEVSDDLDEEQNQNPQTKISSYNVSLLLSCKAAKRVINNIRMDLLPALQNSITIMSTYESYHKLNKKKQRAVREEEEIMRVPIAFAVVKLLQKLPGSILDQSLSGILVKVCNFLKSPLRSVRMATRDVLRNIMISVGTSYLPILLDHLIALLTRGFQLHVLTVTMYSILDGFKTVFRRGDVDKNLQNVLSICLDDIFGRTAEEKEIKKIGFNTPEAKPSNKSYLTLYILAYNITEECMLDLITPFKGYLEKSQSKKVVSKVQECFQKIVSGLILNKHIPLESLIMFIYGTISESIPELLPNTQKPVLSEAEKMLIRKERPDTFIIPPAPRFRTNVVRSIRTNVQANAHVIVELGLELFYMILKRGKLLKINYQPFIEPLMPIVVTSLKSSHLHVTVFALKCLTSIWNREMNLNYLRENVDDIAIEIFNILHKYATAGLSIANDNYTLVKTSFKATVSLLRCAPYFKISADQLRTLLLYVEQNLYDSQKQSVSFALLRVIIGRKLKVPEIYDVMQKLSTLAITSESASTQKECKGLIVNYLMDYPLGKRVGAILKFFVRNLSYEVEVGRLTTIEILHSIMKRFPVNVLSDKSGFLFMSLGARLVDDESTECRSKIAQCIETLISKLDKNTREQLFNIVLILLSDSKTIHGEMGALLCMRFINVEQENFYPRLSNVFPKLINQLSLFSLNNNEPGRFVRVSNGDDEYITKLKPSESLNIDNDDEDIMESNKEELAVEQQQRNKDHQLIQSLNAILKIIETFPKIIDSGNMIKYIDSFSYECQRLLAYEHVWVRLKAARGLEIILNKINVKSIQDIILHGKSTLKIENDYLYLNPLDQIKSLILDLCAQLLPEETDTEIAEQVMKCLIYVAKILSDIPMPLKSNGLNENEGETERIRIHLGWLLRRIRYVINAEVARSPHSIILRTAAFHWLEAVIQMLSDDHLSTLITSIISPLVREMSEEDKNIDPKLRQLAIKVGNRIRKRIGDELYNKLRSQHQSKLMVRRAERKRKVAQLKVTDPQAAAQRKDGDRERKKKAKRRRLEVLKGNVLPKKRKRKTEDVDDLF